MALGGSSLSFDIEACFDCAWVACNTVVQVVPVIKKKKREKVVGVKREEMKRGEFWKKCQTRPEIYFSGTCFSCYTNKYSPESV